jgi:serine/threonine protein kinase
MSPEQTRGETLDPRSDVYTLGVILYELVALKSPYDAHGIPEVILAISEGAIEPIGSACPGVSPALASVIEHAMAMDPEARYPSVAALGEDVETAMDGGTPQAESASIARRVERFYMRDRHPWLRSMHMLDLELLMGSATSFGAGVALLVVEGSLAWSIGLIAAAAVMTGVSVASWIRRHRAQSGA